MSMVYRRISECEYEDARRLWSICFSGDTPAFIDYYFARRTCYENVLAAFENETMVAALHMLPYRANFYGEIKDVCFVAGVATLPSHRMRGIAYALINRAFYQMKDSGYSVCMLQPFNFDFYRKLGFVEFVYRNRFTLIDNNTHAALTPLEPNDMKRKYDAFMQNYSGFMLRDIDDCEKLIAEPRYGAAVALGDAYAIYEDTGDEISVYEVIGQEDVLKLLKAISARTRKRVVFHLPTDVHMQGLEGSREPFDMLRIIDIPKFLIGLPAEVNGTISVTVGQCPWNNAEYYVECKAGRISGVEACAHGCESIGIDALALAFTAGKRGGMGNICFTGNKTNYALEQY